MLQAPHVARTFKLSNVDLAIQAAKGFSPKEEDLVWRVSIAKPECPVALAVEHREACPERPWNGTFEHGRPMPGIGAVFALCDAT